MKDNVVGEKPDERVKDISKSTPNLEFELKFRRVSERLYTKKAREIAKERLRFMENFFEKLKREIKGEV